MTRTHFAHSPLRNTRSARPSTYRARCTLDNTHIAASIAALEGTGSSRRNAGTQHMQVNTHMFDERHYSTGT